MVQKKITLLDKDKRRALIDEKDTTMSLRRQCELVRISRSTLYYERRVESFYNLELMHLINEEFSRHPCKGVGQMTIYLRKEHGRTCGPKRIRRLMRKMGLEAIYPKRNTSRANKQHKIYPYLLRGVPIEECNQVWSTDITYIRLGHGFAYLVVIMDWHSRAVLSWRLSNTMDQHFCCEVLDEALKNYGCPDIFNSDQGSQFTSEAFVSRLKEKRVSISMDGQGCALDNIFVERLWRTVKYEDVYLKGYETMQEAERGLQAYFEYYNHSRFHSALDGQTPWEVYSGKRYRMVA